MAMVISFCLTLLGVFTTGIGAIVGRILLALGLSYFTYQGADKSVVWIFDAIRSSTSGMPSSVVGLLGFLWVDKAISMMAAAFATSLAVNSVGGSITKLRFGAVAKK